MAERITVFLAAVQERAQTAERERAVAVARAIEERRRRKVQLALAASVLAFTTLGGLSTTYYLQERQARAAAGQRVIDQVTTLQQHAVAQPEDIRRWKVALAAVEQADTAGDPKTKAQLVALRNQIQAGLAAAQRDKALLDRLVDIRSAKEDDRYGSATDAAYAGAFRDAGIDLVALPPAQVGAKIQARPSTVAVSLSAALDDWAAVRATDAATEPAQHGWPRPPAPPTPTRGATDSATPWTPLSPTSASTPCTCWSAQLNLKRYPRLASTCWGWPSETPVMPERRSACCARPSAAMRATSGSTTTWPCAWSG